MLYEPDIIRFAKREISAIAGLNTRARFFLAGGAFKTLLTGRPPRDIDLFAPSKADRDTLIATLLSNNARLLKHGSFSDAYKIDGRVVEVAHKVAYSTIEERLGRFDIALSAVGVEHLSGLDWRAVIHPLAQKSVSQKSIFLIKPLVNRSYALTTLARMRRYADELKFVIPPEEESEVWRVFDNQSCDERIKMIKRYKQTIIDDYGVAEEAACRFQ